MAMFTKYFITRFGHLKRQSDTVLATTSSLTMTSHPKEQSDCTDLQGMGENVKATLYNRHNRTPRIDVSIAVKIPECQKTYTLSMAGRNDILDIFNQVFTHEWKHLDRWEGGFTWLNQGPNSQLEQCKEVRFCAQQAHGFVKLHPHMRLINASDDKWHVVTDKRELRIVFKTGGLESDMESAWKYEEIRRVVSIIENALPNSIVPV